ncbi:acyl-CoA dehydrogenase [Mycolicibacterium fortuitum]|uniref:Acyl-CoA dehydrogenase n=1 Tax=Mycolicibacterium fortuitum TaxID=1766 RepID=A0ABD6QC97_MYCFO|nr:acyl-CoA dehydrogenase [Mycolicibacterium fortuitum]
MDRDLFSARHHEFRGRVREFLREEVVPDYPNWLTNGAPSRQFWRRAGEVGILGIGIPEELGGLANSDFRDSMIVTEEIQRLGMAIGGLRVQTDICIPYLLHHGSPAQQREWLPKMASGEVVIALGMSEPEAGSDVKAMTTRAVGDGDEYVIDGAKTFISNGSIADLIVLAAKTDPSAGRKGISLFLVNASAPGFKVGRKLEKLGLHGQDLAELSFTDLRLPADHLLGQRNQGFGHLTANLAAERLSIAVNSQASAAGALHWTIEALSQVRNGQETKFALATHATEVAAGQAFIDDMVRRLLAGTLTGAQAAAAKLFCTELQGRVSRGCVELLGPAIGYTEDSVVGNLFLDGRVSRIYGGSSEILRVIISHDLGV